MGAMVARFCCSSRNHLSSGPIRMGISCSSSPLKARSALRVRALMRTLSGDSPSTRDFIRKLCICQRFGCQLIAGVGGNKAHASEEAVEGTEASDAGANGH